MDTDLLSDKLGKKCEKSSRPLSVAAAPGSGHVPPGSGEISVEGGGKRKFGARHS